MEEIEIKDFKIYPNGVPINCKYRVWTGATPYCTKGNIAAVTVTDDDVKYAPKCSKKQCNRAIMKGVE
jgi:hypothetical protein